MLGYVAIVHTVYNLIFFYILIEGKERPAKTKLFPAKLRAVWYCAESDSAQYHTARSHVFREYLRENEFFSETILDCLSGTQMGWINEEEKNAKKSRDTASLKRQCHKIFRTLFFFMNWTHLGPW